MSTSLQLPPRVARVVVVVWIVANAGMLIRGLVPAPRPWSASLGVGLVAALALIVLGIRTRAATWVVVACFAALLVLDAGKLLAYNGLALRSGRSWRWRPPARSRRAGRAGW